MDKQTREGALHEAFLNQAEVARDMCDHALADIDAVLKDEEDLMAQLKVSVDYGNITAEEAEACLRSYHMGRIGGNPEPV